MNIFMLNTRVRFGKNRTIKKKNRYNFNRAAGTNRPATVLLKKQKNKQLFN